MTLRTDARRQLILGHVSGSRIFRAWRAGEETERQHDHDPTQLRATLVEEGAELGLNALSDTVEIFYRDPNNPTGQDQVTPMLVFDPTLGQVVHVWSLGDIESAVPSWDGKSPVDLEGRIFLTRAGTKVVLPSDGTYLRWKTLVGLTSGGIVGSIAVYNVKDYGAVGDGVTNDTNAIRAAVTACQLAGGGIVYFPNGTYLISEHGTSLRCIELFSRVSIVGQSNNAVIKAAAGLRTSCRMLYVTPGSTDLTIANIKLDGNRANQTDQTGLFHNDGIFLDNTARVHIYDVEVGFTAASPLVIFQNSVDTLVQHCYLHDGGWLGVALGDAFGQKNVLVSHCRLQGNAGGFHMEVSGNCDNVRVEHSYMDATAGNAALEFVGGSGSAKWATNLVAHACQVVGYVQISSVANVTLDSVNATNSDVAPNPHAAFRVTGDVDNVTAQKCTFIQTATGNGASAVLVAGNTNNDVTGVRLLDCDIQVQGTAQDGIFVQQTSSFTMRGGRIMGNASISSGFYGVNVNSKVLPSQGTIRIEDVHIIDFQYGVVAQSASGAIHTNSLTVSGCKFEAKSPGVMQAAMSLDLDNRHSVQAMTAIGNDLIGLTTMFATFPNVPMLIGGNRGAVSDWSGNGAPTFAAAIGSTYRRRDGGASTSLYVNETGTTTWAAK